MSIETLLTEIRDALKENVAALKEAAAGRQEVLAVAKAATEGAATKPRATKKAEEAPAAEQAPAAAETAPTGAEDGLSVEDVNNSIVAYLTGSERPEERTARGAKVLEIIKKVNPEGKNGGDVPADKRQVFINTMNQLLERGDITQPAEADSLLG